MADLEETPQHLERHKWVFEQYIYEGRTYADLAGELSLSQTRVRALVLQWARYLGLDHFAFVELKRRRKLGKRKGRKSAE